MDAYLMHTNESIFPDALEFKPERWLGGSEPVRTRAPSVSLLPGTL